MLQMKKRGWKSMGGNSRLSSGNLHTLGGLLLRFSSLQIASDFIPETRVLMSYCIISPSSPLVRVASRLHNLQDHCLLKPRFASCHTFNSHDEIINEQVTEGFFQACIIGLVIEMQQTAVLQVRCKFWRIISYTRPAPTQASQFQLPIFRVHSGDQCSSTAFEG